MLLHDRLRELRGNRTQTKMAELLGVKPNNYNGWENGKEPNIETLIKIADYHGVTLDYLTGRTDFKNADYQQTTIETGLTENTIKYIRSMSPEVRDILEPIAKELVEDENAAKQKVKLLHAITGISTEDIVLLHMIAKRFPRRRSTNE